MERFKNTQREYLYERIDNILLTITKTNKDYKELTNNSLEITAEMLYAYITGK